jgi:DNA-binding NarL/FixJ family response regulator
LEDAAILVVDDDDSFRALTVSTLTDAGYSTREAGSGASALVEAAEKRPVAALVDVNLPAINGYEVCRALKERYRIPVILVSGYRTEPLDEAGGLLVGADDYLVKPIDPHELLARLRRLVEPLLGAVGHEDGLLARLTAREREITQLLVDGLKPSRIASELFIAPKTVNTHIHRILSKLGVHSRSEAVALAVLEGLSPRRPAA